MWARPKPSPTTPTVSACWVMGSVPVRVEVRADGLLVEEEPRHAWQAPVRRSGALARGSGGHERADRAPALGGAADRRHRRVRGRRPWRGPCRRPRRRGRPRVPLGRRPARLALRAARRRGLFGLSATRVVRHREDGREGECNRRRPCHEPIVPQGPGAATGAFTLTPNEFTYALRQGLRPPAPARLRREGPVDLQWTYRAFPGDLPEAHPQHRHRDEGAGGGDS